MRKKNSLSTKLTIVIILAVLILASALVTIMIFSMNYITDAILIETMRPLAKTAAMSVQGNLHLMADRIFLIRDNPILSDPDESMAQKQRVLDIAESGIEFSWLNLYSADGHLDAGTFRGPSEIYSRDLFTVMNETRNLAIGDVQINGPELEIMVGCPVIVRGQIIHYLVGSYKYDILSDVLGYIDISSGSLAYIINRQGKYMAHQDIRKVRRAQSIFDDNPGISDLGDVLAKITRHQIGVVRVESDGAQKFLCFAPVRGTHWYFVIEVPHNDFMTAIRRGILTSIQLTLILLIVFMIAANVFVVRQLTTPLRNITDHAQHLRRGEFEYPLPPEILKRSDEIGQLAGAFTSMSRSFKHVIEDIEAVAHNAGCGSLDQRVDISLLKGDFLKIAVEMNGALDLICSYLHAIPEAIALFNEKREMLFHNRAMEEFLIVHELEDESDMLLEKIAGGGFDSSDTLDPVAAAVFSPNVSSPYPYTTDIAMLGINGADNYTLQLQRVGNATPDQDSLCVILMLSDVTQLTRAKLDAEAASQAKSDFLSRMSHEIRTPINAMTGMTQIAKASDDIEKIHGCLSRIESSSSQLVDIINDIFDFSKIESGKLSLDITQFSLPENLDFVLSMVHTKAQEKNINVRLITELEHDTVSTDPLRLNQVLMNLLSNAIKFSPEESEVQLIARETAWEDGYGTYSFMVVDHGIGIGAEQMDRLFRPFEQVDGSLTRNYGGTGLGLVLCKSLVEMLGGAISLQSTKGEGSTFIFTVRCLAQLAALETENDSPIAFPVGESIAFDFSGKRCLVVDDIDINREIVMELLSETGLEMETAENGKDALEKFIDSGEGYFDIILMDMQMPVMDGCTATRMIRELDRKDAKKVPVIAMTANVLQEDIQRAMESGMNTHVCKPIDLELVLKTLQEQLK